MNALNTLTLSTVRNESVILCQLRDTTVAYALRERKVSRNENEHWTVHSVRGQYLGQFYCANAEADAICIELVSDSIFECLTGFPEGVTP